MKDLKEYVYESITIKKLKDKIISFFQRVPDKINTEEAMENIFNKVDTGVTFLTKVFALYLNKIDKISLEEYNNIKTHDDFNNMIAKYFISGINLYNRSERAKEALNRAVDDKIDSLTNFTRDIIYKSISKL